MTYLGTFLSCYPEKIALVPFLHRFIFPLVSVRVPSLLHSGNAYRNFSLLEVNLALDQEGVIHLVHTHRNGENLTPPFPSYAHARLL